ncbi:DUF3068 domain-containing protein [Nocardioides houyundeii]|uniref:DUF3068 domain-containing protein n=1 Tax=Nocardioides houyundeii TaxID=2045452 RepID=UPI000DF14E99|nr:DUF3068 domain-containing protein [Nocardioides houyundeii]
MLEGALKVRGKLGLILSGLGGFLVVAAVMAPVFIYPSLAVAPADQKSETTLFGPGAILFDIASLSEITTDVTTSAKTEGDVAASEELGDNIVVWTNSTSTKSADGERRSASVERVAFDAHTGEAVDYDGAYSMTVEGQPDGDVVFEGQVFKFPFQTEKKTYQWWDGTLLRAEPAEFVDVDKIEDLEVYKFVQTIEPEVWTQMDVPGDVVGEKGDSVTADRTYGNIRTFWVEPETGVVIKREEKQSATLQIDGEDRATLTDVVTSFTDKSVQTNVDDYGPKASQLKLIRTTLPIVLGILGLALMILGTVLTRRHKRVNR